MKTIISLILSLLSLSALAQAPIIRGPGTTNTPAVWTNIVGVISVNSNALALSQKADTNDLRALRQTNTLNTFGGNGAALTSIAASNIVSGGTIAAAAFADAQGKQTNGLTAVAFNNVTPPFTNSVIGYGNAQNTNAFAIGPGGTVSSNALGNATTAAGTVTTTQNGVSGSISSNAVVVGQIIGSGTAPTITQDGILQVVASGGNALRFWVKLNATNNMIGTGGASSKGTNILTATYATTFPSAPRVLMSLSTNASLTIYNQGTPEIYANTASSFSMRWWSGSANSWLTSGTNFTFEFFLVQ